MVMHNETTWELPFGQPPELELHAEWGNLRLMAVENGGTPRLELSRSSAEHMAVRVEKVGATVRVMVEPKRNFSWFGNWEARATLYLPPDVRASVQTNAGSVAAEDLVGCELGIKANAGKIDLRNIYGLMHLSADAGSVTGRDVGGYFDVETQAGSVRLDIVDLQPGEHRIRAAMGAVRLELARGMDVCIETHTSLGSVRNNFPSRQTAPARLLLSTEMGSLRVEEGSARRPVWRPGPSSYAPDRPTEPRPPEQAAAAHEDPELERILKMVEAGELSAHDADELLKAMGRV
jgi:hypothetical protein